MFDEHPDDIYKKISELLLKTEDKNDPERRKNATSLILKMHSVGDLNKRHMILANSVGKDYVTACIELTNNLIDEYQCITSLEKTLCEIIANSYGKVMHISNRMTSCLVSTKYLSDETTRWMNMLSKELDRANRNYLTAINNLIEIKRPLMNVNVKTKNAYFGQNQQFNNNQTDDANINT